MTATPAPCHGGRLPHLRAELAAVRYNEAAIRDRLAVPATSPLPPAGHALGLARIALGQQDTQGALIRLLLLGQPIRLSDTPQLAAELVDTLTNTRLVEHAGDVLHPLVRLTPFHDLLLAADLHNEDSAEVKPDAVESPHRPTETLARLIPRETVGRSLDIGTGSGVHALQLARHSDTVLGVDVSPRATAFAQFNAALNEITNTRFDIADVVSGIDDDEPFNLIVSNPPYLVSPERSVVYRDGPPESAHVGTRVLSEAPARLTHDGLLVCLTSWGISNPGDPAREIRSIARRTGCNAVVFVYAVRSGPDDALRWNVHRREPDQIHQAARRWLDFYREQGIGELAYGVVVFTPARERQPWFRTEQVTLQGQEFDRGQLRDITSALDRTHRGRIPEDLTPHPDHEIESVGKIGTDGTPTVREQLLCSTRGMRFAVECGPRLLNAIATGTAPTTSEPTTEVIVTMRRRLYELGLLIGGADD
ncbi:methyltransferase [Prauserella endophytica]|uniref:Methyltransferase n=1 Tax=Prauserella endophytica TaxID=1592324 RepID=A0ABY2RZB2_9PSEU|nr:methyltransferase [Prauserella endophytica]TKG66270.1 methyltransferase [Prauserella endophytica]